MDNYRLLPNWPHLPGDLKLGNPTGIGIDSNQNIFVFHRADRKWSSGDAMPETCILSDTILLLDKDNGEILNSWGGGFFIMPHGLTVDRNNDIWVTDVGSHQVFKFSPEGKLLLQLGEAKVPGNDPAHFNFPTDVAVAEDCSLYVSDGYGNSRVMKFSSVGKYLFEWGKKGNKAGEFNLPHAIDLDDEENVYIADRENCRVQVFTPTGKFIKEWADKSFGRISSVAFNRSKKGFIAVDYATSSSDIVLGSHIILFDSSGHLITKLATKDGIGCWYHNILVDDQGYIYVTDILGNSIQKFEKISGPLLAP